MLKLLKISRNMENVETIKLTNSEKHRRVAATLHAWTKRKEERQKQVWKDFEDGKYDETIKRLRKLNENQ